MRHIISVLLENEAGALSRVAGLFSARGYNIESLTVAPTEDPTLSRMTLVTAGDEAIIEQITKQLNKLVDVVKLVDLSEGAHIERELMMIGLHLAQERDVGFSDLALIGDLEAEHLRVEVEHRVHVLDADQCVRPFQLHRALQFRRYFSGATFSALQSRA